ncbi:hypothetical protein WH52_06765 [Tenacibaculum holothuriorum]|uniref:Uncharacterized protein n=1 Tax=Tenacibaculum holothuriorum TaxID=1635173 RepID=A0A1Y2PE59_9FLAO|nr:hypothetical protein [Tenacibaculum holothuriorum]OSY88450.1 hypothetical protein WH52_06765 [Tenacibaculum holothuriorum]
MKKNLILLRIIILLIGTSVFSQESSSNRVIDENTVGFIDDLTRGQIIGFRVKNKTKKEILEGDKFLYKEWNNKLMLYTTDNKSYRFNNSNYDFVEDAFSIMISKDSVFNFNNDRIKFVRLNNKTFKKLVYKSTNHFYEVLTKGSISFYKRFTYKIRKGKVDPFSKEKISKDKIVMRKKYFILKNNYLQELRLKKNDLFKYFDDEKLNLIKRYAKENNLSCKKEKGVIKILKYVNTL